MLEKAAASDADLVFVDLEDAVAPERKVEARGLAAAALTGLAWSPARACRINGVHTQWCHGDLEHLVRVAGTALDIVIVPKVRGPRDVWFVDDLLTQLELEHRLELGRIGIEVLIEETEALAVVEEIARCSGRIEALILGTGDLAASQGVRTRFVGAEVGGAPYPGDLWHYARSRMIVAARANGLDAVDGPYGDYRDPEGYRQAAHFGSTLGAVGKWCIHPSQIEVANEVFAPTAEEIRHALDVTEAVRLAEARGLGATSHGGALIDLASRRVQETVLRRARLCGMLGAEKSGLSSLAAPSTLLDSSP